MNKGFTKRINGVTKDESDMLLQYLFNVSQKQPICQHLVKLTFDSSSHKTTTRRFASGGTRMIWPSGITDPPGTAPLMTTLKPGLVTGSAVWVKLLTWTSSPNPGSRRWQRLKLKLGILVL